MPVKTFPVSCRLKAELSGLAYDPQAQVQTKETLSQLAAAEKQHLQLQQAETELLALQAQRQHS